MWLIRIRYYLVACGFPVFKVWLGYTPEMSGCWTGPPGPQATNQRITGKAACALRLLGTPFGAWSLHLPCWGCERHPH